MKKQFGSHRSHISSMRKKRKMIDYEDELHQAQMEAALLQRKLKTMTTSLTNLTMILSKLDQTVAEESPTQSLPEVASDLVAEPVSESIEYEIGPNPNAVRVSVANPNRIQEPTRSGVITSAHTQGVITDDTLEEGDGERHAKQR